MSEARPHHFVLVPFKDPVNCSFCHKRIFGLGIEAYRCRDCSYVAHTECQVKVPQTCSARVTSSSSKTRKGFGSFMPRIASKKLLGKHLPEEIVSEKHQPSAPLEFTAVETPAINWNVRRPKVHPLAEHAMAYLAQEEVLKLEGIFRLSGATKEVEKLQTRLLQTSKVDLKTELPTTSDQAHVVATLLKWFVRDIHPPIFTHELYPVWIAISNVSKSEGWSGIVPTLFKKATNILPIGARMFVRNLCFLLKKCSTMSDLNKMTISNLAICFAPSLLRPQVETIAILLSDSPAANRCISLMIENCEDLFALDSFEAELPEEVPPNISALFAAALAKLEIADKADKELLVKEMNEKENRIRCRTIQQDFAKTLLQDVQHRAAVLIQSVWKGYRLRKAQKKSVLSVWEQVEFNGLMRSIARTFRKQAIILDEILVYRQQLMNIATSEAAAEAATQQSSKEMEGGDKHLKHFLHNQVMNLRKKNKLLFATEEEIEVIFSNVGFLRKMIGGVYYQLQQLEDSWPFLTPSSLLPLLTNKLLPFMNLLVEYVVNFSSSQRTLSFCCDANALFEKWLDRMAMKSTIPDTPLYKLLAVPLKFPDRLQRLLQRVLACCLYKKEFRSDLLQIARVSATLMRFYHIVSAAKERYKTLVCRAMEEMISSSPGYDTPGYRRVIQKWARAKLDGKKLHMILFEDGTLIFAKPSKGGETTIYRIRHIIDLLRGNCSVDAHDTHESTFVVHGPTRDFVVVTETKKASIHWCQEIENILHHNQRLFRRALIRIVDKQGLPPKFRVMSDFLLAQISVERLFLQTSTRRLVERVKQSLSEHQNRGEMLNGNPHAVAETWKLFLQQLPEPVMSTEVCKKIHEFIFQDHSKNDIISNLSFLFVVIDAVNATLLREVMTVVTHIFTFCYKSDPFVLEILALSLAPIIVWSQKDTPSAALNIDTSVEVIRLLIAHWEEVASFKVTAVDKSLANSPYGYDYANEYEVPIRKSTLLTQPGAKGAPPQKEEVLSSRRGTVATTPRSGLSPRPHSGDFKIFKSGWAKSAPKQASTEILQRNNFLSRNRTPSLTGPSEEVLELRMEEMRKEEEAAAAATAAEDEHFSVVNRSSSSPALPPQISPVITKRKANRHASIRIDSSSSAFGQVMDILGGNLDATDLNLSQDGNTLVNSSDATPVSSTSRQLPGSSAFMIAASASAPPSSFLSLGLATKITKTTTTTTTVTTTTSVSPRSTSPIPSSSPSSLIPSSSSSSSTTTSTTTTTTVKPPSPTPPPSTTTTLPSAAPIPIPSYTSSPPTQPFALFSMHRNSVDRRDSVDSPIATPPSPSISPVFHHHPRPTPVAPADFSTHSTTPTSMKSSSPSGGSSIVWQKLQ